MRPEWTALEQVVAIGAEWLRTGRQPRKAIMQHHGKGGHAGGTLKVRFAPYGRTGGKSAGGGLDAVVIFDMSEHEWYDWENDERGPVIPPFTEGEIAEFKALLERNGLPVRDEWNGAGLRTASFAIAAKTVEPTLNATVRRYLKGCPVHESVFCGREHHHPDCDWHAAFDLLIPPVFPDVPLPVPPASGPSDDDRNLLAVKRVLERITPILAEMGYHPAMVVAGKRGHIEGEDDALQFVPDMGHGVLIPAEMAESLVAIAAEAFTAGLVERGAASG